MRHIFILNPAAGREDSTGRISEQITNSFGNAAEIYRTVGIGDATNYVRRYGEEHPEEPLRFYACGGDGTLSEVVSGAVGLSNAAVGLIPIGTGNDFVRNFTNIPQFLSLEAQKEGKEVWIDLLRCNDRYCVNMLNTGFDCEVVVQAAKIKRTVPSGMAYLLGIVRELAEMPGVEMTLMVDGKKVPCGEKFLCAVANGGYCGGGFHPSPRASLNDGYIDVCLVNRVSRLRFLRLVGSYKKGTHINPKTKDVLTSFRCRSLVMEFPQPRHVSIDGELPLLQRCEIAIVPSALKFVLPSGCEMIFDAMRTEKNEVMA